MSSARTIDVHAHYLPEGYRAALLDNGHDHPDGFPEIPAWSAEEHVAAMTGWGSPRRSCRSRHPVCTSVTQPRPGASPAR